MRENYPKEVQWIKLNANRLNISGIEQDCLMPANTLYGWIKEKRAMAEHWDEKLVKWVKKFTKSLEKG